MKKEIKNYLMGGMALLFSLASCGDIEEGDRVIFGEEEILPRPVETTFMVGFEDQFFEVDNLHRMLITDFTGWKCVNCPDMAEFLTTRITPNYPSVLVSLHMTSNSFSAGHIDGYNCASADSILNWMAGSNMASIIGLPSVSIDNMKSDKGNILIPETTELESLAQKRFKDSNINKTTPRITIGLNSEKSSDGNYLISTLVIAQNPTKVCLQLWLIEEDLISTVQQSKTGYIFNYENHGILRQVINGSYEGQILSLEYERANMAQCKLNISGKNYKAENCRVVAIVTDPDTREVLNCLETEL